MKAKRLADLASQMCNSARSWSGSLHPDERDDYVRECDQIKRAIRHVILHAPQSVVDRAEQFLEDVR